MVAILTGINGNNEEGVITNPPSEVGRYQAAVHDAACIMSLSHQMKT